MPQFIAQSNERYVLNAHVFTFNYARDSAARAGCAVLDDAFIRYFRIVFPDFVDGAGSHKTHVSSSTDKLPEKY